MTAPLSRTGALAGSGEQAAPAGTVTPAGAAAAPPPVPLHRSLGLTDHELDAIRERLGRAPNDLELAMFSV
ncbi:MAG: hypothetical protein ACR2JZ_02540, partial [Candidatus Limnocylindrales bacterium]